MLRLRMNWNISLNLNHEPKGMYGQEARVFLVKKGGESMRHVLMKLLSYMLFYEDGLLIEAHADQHFKPDLVEFNDQLEPVQWIDCGQTGMRKLDIISRRNHETYIDIIKSTPGELRSYKRQAETRLARPERVRYWSFGERLIERLGALIRGRHEIDATISPEFEHMWLLIDGIHTLNAPIIAMHDVSHNPGR